MKNLYCSLPAPASILPAFTNSSKDLVIVIIPSFTAVCMQTAVKEGMITMTKSLEELVKAGKIDAGAGKEQ